MDVCFRLSSFLEKATPESIEAVQLAILKAWIMLFGIPGINQLWSESHDFLTCSPVVIHKNMWRGEKIEDFM